MRLRVVPYKRGSESAMMLARELSTHANHRVLSGKPMSAYQNIMWGRSDISPANALQSADAINVAKNKLATFKVLKEKGVPIPEFSDNKATAQAWITAGRSVFARQYLSACSGRGIVHVKEGQLPDAPLYVRFMKSNHEFRVHVVNGEVIDVQEKRRRHETETNATIRNHDNGWVFCHQDIVEPENLRTAAVNAVKAVGLLFGAVDIIYNSRFNKLYVLEINTAPGLSPQTAKKYSDALYAVAVATAPPEIVPTPVAVTPAVVSRRRNVSTPVRTRRTAAVVARRR